MKSASTIYSIVHLKYGQPGGKADKFDIEAMETYADELFKHRINERIWQLKEKIKMHIPMKNAADGIRKKNIGISITMLEFAVSELQELLK